MHIFAEIMHCFAEAMHIFAKIMHLIVDFYNFHKTIENQRNVGDKKSD